MTKDELLTAVKGEIDYCEQTRLPINPSFASTETERLELIERYMSSRYRDGDTDSLGNPMVFYNISSFPVEVAQKMVDLDTKDITLMPEDERYWETWLMEKELRAWMDDNKFSRFLNELTARLPRDGHVVVKKVSNHVEIVPLKNLRFRPEALSLEVTPIIEKYEYMPDEFIKEAKDRGWENWEKVELDPKKVVGNYNKITVFGCWFPEGFLPIDSNYFIVSYDGQIMADWNQDIFYKGISWEKVFGRLLGRGNVEKLFNEQIYLNRIANYKADGLNWSSKHYFQTRDNSFKPDNLLGNSDNGEVFILNDELKPVAVEERNLAFYAQEEQRWESQAYKRVFTTEPITGNRAPSGTPLGSTILQAQMTQGFYDPKKEDISSFVKEIIEDWVMPDFKKESRKEHKLLMKNLLTSDKGAEKFFQLNLNYRINKQKMFRIMPEEMWEMKKSLMAESLKNTKMTIPKGFYDDLKYKMKIVIGSESIDTAGKLTTLQTLFQIIGSNPSVLENKTTKNILFKMLTLSGFNPKDFEEEEIPSIKQVAAQRGGSIAAPTPSQVPAQLPQLQTA